MDELKEFVGEYEHNLDEKGRLIIPVKFRLLLGERFYLCMSLSEDCLCAYPGSEWKRLSDELLRKIHPLDKEGQKFLRVFTSSACISELDKQGRIFIPQNLRTKARLKSKLVIIVGALSHIELWPANEWKNLNQEVKLTDLAQQIYKNMSQSS